MTDGELVRRAQAGDMRAFDQLVDRHYGPCLRYAWRQLGGRADAQEAVQDAFVRAYRALDRCSPERFGGWLMRIVVNRCRSYGARARRRAALRDRYAARTAQTPSAAAPDAGADADDVAVRRALAGLPPRLREAFLLKHVEELTYEEISALTGVGLSALRMRVKRATDALARALEDSHGTDGTASAHDD